MVNDASPQGTRLGRLRLIGLAAPPFFVSGLVCLHPALTAGFDSERAHLVLSAVLILSAAVFGWTMFRSLGRAHDAALEAERLSAALLERDRIARELHDSLAQVLGVAHLRLRAVEARPSVAADERTRADVADLADLCREAHRDVREAIHGLKDAQRSDRSLLDHLEDYIRVFSRTSGVPTTLEACTERELALPPNAEVQVIRVIQEALTNIRKHAGARSARVLVRADDASVDFVIADDGQGFDVARATGGDGFGLTTMRERTESVRGRLRLESRPGEGTRVTVHLPRTAPARSRVEELTA
ncbi:sensor histidine kinase [Propioniciclava sinopodophylli]|nr:sensor histidine kinase [Propioniciclava sinopodophylli]